MYIGQNNFESDNYCGIKYISPFHLLILSYLPTCLIQTSQELHGADAHHNCVMRCMKHLPHYKFQSEARTQELREFIIPTENQSVRIGHFAGLGIHGSHRRPKVERCVFYGQDRMVPHQLFLHVRFYCPQMMGAIFYCSLRGTDLLFVLLTKICLFLPLFLYDSLS